MWVQVNMDLKMVHSIYRWSRADLDLHLCISLAGPFSRSSPALHFESVFSLFSCYPRQNSSSISSFHFEFQFTIDFEFWALLCAFPEGWRSRWWGTLLQWSSWASTSTEMLISPGWETPFSLGFPTKIANPGLKRSSLVPSQTTGIKKSPLVPAGGTNRDQRGSQAWRGRHLL